MAGPLTAPVQVKEFDQDYIVTSMDVNSDEPVFKGHYPEFPIFPGVCLVEFVNAGAHAAAMLRAQQLHLREVVSVRFQNPVYPGATIAARIDFTEDDGHLDCRARVRHHDVELATVRLRYSVTTDV